MRDYPLAVYIGRFQPFHNGHLDVVEYGLEIADRVLVIVGSSNAARSVKNPFSYEERRMMIEGSIDIEDRGAVDVAGVRDYYYNLPIWLANIQAVVDRHSTSGYPVALIGSYRDSSSFYLNCFPQYDLKIAPETRMTNGTEIRNILWEAAKNEHGHVMPDFEGKVGVDHGKGLSQVAAEVPSGSFTMIQSFIKTEAYARIAKENEFLIAYQDSWKKAPFPPTFVTTDAVVTCAGHVLVVERKVNPGKGLYALPGGFLKQDEFIQDGMLRELREETRIRVAKPILESSIAGSQVFDHPDRSARGRTISHGYHINLKSKELPEVKGGDDAKQAFWMPLWDVVKNEEKFFEDHAHIINHFTNVGAQGER